MEKNWFTPGVRYKYPIAECVYVGYTLAIVRYVSGTEDVVHQRNYHLYEEVVEPVVQKVVHYYVYSSRSGEVLKGLVGRPVEWTITDGKLTAVKIID